MKWDELKDKWFNAYPEIMGIQGDEPIQCYCKADVDTAIDELKTEHHKERDEYISMVYSREQTIKELKAKLEDVKATAYAESVDAGMENRRLKEERRWRKFSYEKPPKYTWCLVSGKSQMGNYIVITDFFEEDDWAENPKLDDDALDIEYWMPLPKAPKEAK